MGPRRQPNFRPQTVQGEPATTGGTPAQLCTFRSVLASPLPPGDPAACRPAPPAARGTQLSQPHGSARAAGE
jgi:hypothetical protein